MKILQKSVQLRMEKTQFLREYEIILNQNQITN